METKPVTYERYAQVINNWTFHGTESYFKIPSVEAVLTDGTLWLATTFDCTWLLGVIAQVAQEHMDEGFMVAEIEIGDFQYGIRFQDGNDREIYTISEPIEQCMPEGHYEVWIGTTSLDNKTLTRVLYLSTEH